MRDIYSRVLCKDLSLELLITPDILVPSTIREGGEELVNLRLEFTNIGGSNLRQHDTILSRIETLALLVSAMPYLEVIVLISRVSSLAEEKEHSDMYVDVPICVYIILMRL